MPPSIRFWLATLAALASSAPARAQLDRMGTPRYNEAIIQHLLDSVGFCELPPGEHPIRRPIRMGPNQRLTGAGPASKLIYSGAGDFALLFGDKDTPNYACYLDNVMFVGGGVKCERFAQHCAIEKTWIQKAPAEGLLVEGIGDKMIFRDVVCYGNKGAGIAVRSFVTNNGLTFDHCNSQANGGYGIVLETTSWPGRLHAAVLRDCTSQGNCAAGHADAEVLVRGWIQSLRIESLWVENGRQVVGLRTERTNVVEPASGKPKWRLPNITIAGNTLISQLERAVELVDCIECQIDQLELRPATARVYWRCGKDGGDVTGSTKPGGLMRRLDATRLMAAPTLGGARDASETPRDPP